MICKNKINYLQNNKLDVDFLKEDNVKHNLFTEKVIKIALSPFLHNVWPFYNIMHERVNDDKRIQSIDSIETYP